jgi:hypothetical protein
LGFRGGQGQGSGKRDGRAVDLVVDDQGGVPEGFRGGQDQGLRDEGWEGLSGNRRPGLQA